MNAKLIAREPTEEMIQAGISAHYEPADSAGAIFRAMWEAAPQVDVPSEKMQITDQTILNTARAYGSFVASDYIFEADELLEFARALLAASPQPEQQPTLQSIAAFDPNGCGQQYGPVKSPPIPEAEFLSKRLARVAKLTGYPMPDMSHEDTAAVAGTILGSIASLLEKKVGEQAAPAQHPLKLDKEKIMRRVRENGMDLEDNPVAYEFYNPTTDHAIVDYTRHTHAGYLSEKDYVAKPLQYAVGEQAAQPAQEQPPTNAQIAVLKEQVLQASLDFIQSLTGMSPPPIEVAPPEVFQPFREFAEKIVSLMPVGQQAAQPEQQPMPDMRKVAEAVREAAAQEIDGLVNIAEAIRSIDIDSLIEQVRKGGA